MSHKNIINVDDLNNWISSQKVTYASDKTYDKRSMRLYYHFNGTFSVTIRDTSTAEENVIYHGSSKEEAIETFNEFL